MSKIVLGLGTSHSPLLTFPAEVWMARAQDDRKMSRLTLSDGRTVHYDDLLAERGPRHEAQASLTNLSLQQRAAETHLDRLADELEAADPDVVVIVGDDQEELFGAGNTPAVALYYGDEIVMLPLSQIRGDLPEWRKQAYRGYMMDAPHRHPGAPAFTEALVTRMMDAGVDLGVASGIADPEKAAFGHAYGFVVARLFRGRPIPVAPLLLNTYYPPNVPTAARCHDIGRALRAAIEAGPEDLRVAVIASGGLSHFATDERLDQTVLGALTGDPAPLRALPRAALRSGSSEILNWVLTAGAVEHLPLAWREYIPVYRTPAGTGVGLGFACWR